VLDALLLYSFLSHLDSTPENAPNIAEVMTALASFLAVGATVWVAIALARGSEKARQQEHRQARRLAMTEAHVRLTTGEVAAARHLIGTLLTTRRRKQLEKVQRNRARYIQAFYTLAWTVESISNLRRTWTSREYSTGRSDYLTWNEDALFESLDGLYALLIATDTSFIHQSREAWDAVMSARCRHEVITREH
jgi:radical SAM superfamily enzyme